MINLGDKVKDKITGLEGIAVSRIEYLNGCVRYEIQPTQTKDGKPIESTFIDSQQIIVLKTSQSTEKKKSPGGSRSIPPKMNIPEKKGV